MNNTTCEHCNAWECEHNKNGYCESEDAFIECHDELLEMIANYKLSADLSNGNDFYAEKEVKVNG